MTSSQNLNKEDQGVFKVSAYYALPLLPEILKNYIERIFSSEAEVCQEYKRFCTEKKITPSSRQVFFNEFDTGNYALFQPRKDQWYLCVSYSEGNVDEERKA
ncbi:hypothetical protein PoB_004661700 [Plakobranchus ocellatus]|uniref:Uncharacterized protein n=1 Tax=Plakobranchus ocellatus TaxID=259542 RepID=A0AAV4BL44_9GAST|nr:hypothetical protein PoB_004661700 [Plakobranchus ocellatus]